MIIVKLQNNKTKQKKQQKEKSQRRFEPVTSRIANIDPNHWATEASGGGTAVSLI